MGNGFLKLVVDRPKKPKRTYAGEPVVCQCGNKRWTKEHEFHYREGRYIQSKHFNLRCPICHTLLVI